MKTLVFVPAWNEEAQPACRARRAEPRAARRGRARRRRRLDGRHAPRSRGPHGADVVSFGENRGLPAGIAAGYARRARARLRVLRPRRRRRPAPGRRAGAPARAGARGRSATSRSARGSRAARGSTPYRYTPSGARRFGTAVAAPRRCASSLRRPFLDATSGMYAANAKALPVLAQPYTSERAGGRGAAAPRPTPGCACDEVPVDMRERASGESKLRGQEGRHARA